MRSRYVIRNAYCKSAIIIHQHPFCSFNSSKFQFIFTLQRIQHLIGKPKGEHFLLIHFKVCCHLNYLARTKSLIFQIGLFFTFKAYNLSRQSSIVEIKSRQVKIWYILSTSLSLIKNPIYNGIVRISSLRPTLYCPSLMAW